MLAKFQSDLSVRIAGGDLSVTLLRRVKQYIFYISKCAIINARNESLQRVLKEVINNCDKRVDLC
jgi:hypothetical protein